MTARRIAALLGTALAVATLVPAAGLAHGGEENAVVLGRYLRSAQRCRIVPPHLIACYEVIEVWEESNGDPRLQTRPQCHPSGARPPCSAGEEVVPADRKVATTDPLECPVLYPRLACIDIASLIRHVEG